MEKDGTPSCFGFVNFKTHEDALIGLRALQNGDICFYDQRGKVRAGKPLQRTIAIMNFTQFAF